MARRIFGLILIVIGVLFAISTIGQLVGGAGEGWTKTAGETSCAEWLDKMTVDDRKGLGEAILTILWEKDGAAQEPPEDKVLVFANAIGGVCSSFRDEKVSTVGAGLYTLSTDVKP